MLAGSQAKARLRRVRQVRFDIAVSILVFSGAAGWLPATCSFKGGQPLRLASRKVWSCR